MNEMPSSQFRKDYAKLREPTMVTVNGHVLGTWMPGPGSWEEVVAPGVVLPLAHAPTDWTKLPGGGIQARQAQRDDLLRKINRSK